MKEKVGENSTIHDLIQLVSHTLAAITLTLPFLHNVSVHQCFRAIATT